MRGCASLVASEARALLLDLLARQEWLAAAEAPPLAGAAGLRPMPGDGPALDEALEGEGLAAGAERLLRAAGWA